MKIALLLVLLALPCPALAQSSAEITAARTAVRGILKDPQSARFSDGQDKFMKPGAICGLVNAKNGYGGYTGDQVYLYIQQSRQAFIWGETSDREVRAVQLQLFSTYCVK